MEIGGHVRIRLGYSEDSEMFQEDEYEVITETQSADIVLDIDGLRSIFLRRVISEPEPPEPPDPHELIRYRDHEFQVNENELAVQELRPPSQRANSTAREFFESLLSEAQLETYRNCGVVHVPGSDGNDYFLSTRLMNSNVYAHHLRASYCAVSARAVPKFDMYASQYLLLTTNAPVFFEVAIRQRVGFPAWLPYYLNPDLNSNLRTADFAELARGPATTAEASEELRLSVQQLVEMGLEVEIMDQIMSGMEAFTELFSVALEEIRIAIEGLADVMAEFFEVLFDASLASLPGRVYDLVIEVGGGVVLRGRALIVGSTHISGEDSFGMLSSRYRIELALRAPDAPDEFEAVPRPGYLAPSEERVVCSTSEPFDLVLSSRYAWISWGDDTDPPNDDPLGLIHIAS